MFGKNKCTHKTCMKCKHTFDDPTITPVILIQRCFPYATDTSRQWYCPACRPKYDIIERGASAFKYYVHSTRVEVDEDGNKLFTAEEKYRIRNEYTEKNDYGIYIGDS